jgi:restriction system protein
MARRRRTSPAEDFIDLVALLPWWGGVVLAIVSYVLLSGLASRPLPVSGRPDVLAPMIKGLATAGQYLLPLICLFGAAASAWRRHDRKALHAGVAANPSADALNGRSWAQFERLVGESFRQQGYAVVETGSGGADGGIDLVLSKAGEKFLVQCKQWRAYKVSVQVVRELYGVMAAGGAAGGFVVTSGTFTDDARQFANGRNIQLIDGSALHAMIRGAAPAPAPASAVQEPSAEAPACPVCARPMVARTAKRGANAGRPFWGCTEYPGCRGTRSMA